jgi:hypothetical protein
MLSFIVELGVSLWGMLMLCSVFLFDMCSALHTDMPRLEGLLVGLLSAWALKNRDKHAALKALSTPLKLMLDGLDLACGQLARLGQKGLSVAKAPFIWLSGKGEWLYLAIKGGASSLVAKLRKKKS